MSNPKDPQISVQFSLYAMSANFAFAPIFAAPSKDLSPPRGWFCITQNMINNKLMSRGEQDQKGGSSSKFVSFYFV